ncbi:MAG: rod shape-determining protein RodA [Bacteroidales bacterium]|nr:rod shape-determining protein RodA [Bacteroidales bacterium]
MDKYSRRTIGQSYDWRLVVIYLLLVFIGWINIYASVHGTDVSGILDFSANSGKQFIWMLTAFGLGGIIIFIISPNLWDSGAAVLYAGVLVLLVAVIFLGVEVKGSRSWFAFGPVRFQPAEISKITTSLLLAFIMSRPGFRITKPANFITAAVVIGLPMLIILAESETGSALVYVGFIFVLYREGLSGWLITMIGIAILVFILTMTASPYTAILVLTGIIATCNSFNHKNIGRWLIGTATVIAFFAFLPGMWTGLQNALIPGAGVIASGEAEPEIAAAAASSTWGFLLKIRPLYFLLGAAALSIPAIIWLSFKYRDTFARYSVLSFIVGVAMVFSVDFIFYNVLQEHQRKRIEVLLGMKEDPSGVGYNVNQSMIAIGSGGFAGKGYLSGTQTTYGFVPEQSTDFIFCTVGEEWGFIGCLVVIALYVMLIMRILKDAEHSRESFTRIYGYCLASCLFMHLFINIGMTIGIMPVIGIPLPFMSYGGSSLWAFTIMLAIFISLDHQEKKYF